MTTNPDHHEHRRRIEQAFDTGELIPALELHDDSTLTDAERAELLEAWHRARNGMPAFPGRFTSDEIRRVYLERADGSLPTLRLPELELTDATTTRTALLWGFACVAGAALGGVVGVLLVGWANGWVVS